jgi:hypothetical protein
LCREPAPARIPLINSGRRRASLRNSHLCAATKVERSGPNRDAPAAQRRHRKVRQGKCRVRLKQARESRKARHAPCKRKETSTQRGAELVIVEHPHRVRAAGNRFHRPNPLQVGITARFAAPPSPPPGSPWGTPPGTAASLRPRSRCADRLRRATPDERCAAPATTSD